MNLLKPEAGADIDHVIGESSVSMCKDPRQLGSYFVRDALRTVAYEGYRDKRIEGGLFKVIRDAGLSIKDKSGPAEAITAADQVMHGQTFETAACGCNEMAEHPVDPYSCHILIRNALDAASIENRRCGRCCSMCVGSTVLVPWIGEVIKITIKAERFR